MAAQAGTAASRARPQTASATAQTSEQAFKNVQVLKGIPVDDFMGTMGIMSAATGFDCSECHTGAGTDQVDWAVDTPRKRTARKMVEMVAALNRTNFGGRQVVTCWTCHRGRDRPLITPAMETVYGTPEWEMDDVIIPGQGGPTADQILDKYIQAIGGAQRLAGLTSYIGKGTSVGFGGFGGEGQVEIFAKAPDQRTVVIEFTDADRGNATRSFDGRVGWQRTPLSVLDEYEISGSELDGARLDAQLSFPGQIKGMLTNLRVGSPTTISDLPAPSSQAVVPMFGTGSRRPGDSGKRPSQYAGHTLFRPGVRVAAANGALWQLTDRPATHADRLCGLSGRGRHQVAVPHDVRVAERTRCHSAERGADERPDRRREVRPAGAGERTVVRSAKASAERPTPA